MLLLAAFVPLTPNEGDGASPGTDVVVQVYVKVDSPAVSAPSTVRTVDVPATGLGAARAAVAIVGAGSDVFVGKVNETGLEANPLATTDTAYVLGGSPRGSAKLVLCGVEPV